MAKANIDPDIAEEIIEKLRAGAFLEAAVREVGGVTSRTVRSWLNKGKHEQEKRDKGYTANTKLDDYVVFYEFASGAMGEAENRSVNVIKKSDDWRAHAWYLERKWPKQWGKQLNLHLTDEYERMLDKLERLLPEDVFDQVLEAMAIPEELIGVEEDDEDEEDQDGLGDEEPVSSES